MNSSDLYNAAKGELRRIGHDYANFFFNGTGFEQAIGRPPYRYALGREDGGLRIYGGGHLNSILFELSGKGCHSLDDYEVATGFIRAFAPSLTRLDYAVDVRCDTLPSAFSNVRRHQSFRSISFIRSSTGETVYVGSPKSDRFARVYRYNKPHPRSELLRIEHVFRRGLAKSAFQALEDAGSFQAFSALLGNTYGWSHPDWKPGELSSEKLKVPKLEKADENTVHWLYTQVAPALARLMREGAIDLDEFISHALSIGRETPEA